CTCLLAYIIVRQIKKFKQTKQLKKYILHGLENISYPDSAWSIFLLYSDLCRFFDQKGISVSPQMTPYEYLDRLRPQLGMLYPIPVEITELFCSTRYG